MFPSTGNHDDQGGIGYEEADEEDSAVYDRYPKQYDAFRQSDESIG